MRRDDRRQQHRAQRPGAINGTWLFSLRCFLAWLRGDEAKSLENPVPATSNIVEQSPLGTFNRSSFDAAKGNRAGQPSSRNIMFSTVSNVSALRPRIGVTPEA
ncbi:hypothetical protein E4U24_007606 [Claviceps purpurea]|nr:hypothetical protein E4U24_007606 [Claviceps purpurea]